MVDDAELLSLAQQLGAALAQQSSQLSLAESCTGGWVAQCATAIPGSSAWLERGFVTYSNAAKQEMLGVGADTLQAFGAVSEATAKEMALGALAYSHADLSAAITGIAGPEGGSAEKPVGTVCFGWAHRDGRLWTRRLQFAGDREAVRRQAVKTALQGLLHLTLGTEFMK
ncbi:nicotinamide-nucleotide amidase [Methylobacillus glycogenes]|uniref:nicotinamide-nucleotide amidase n=1 Tax=Methylobacillus glycogenes TaxID=406 RepID=UPI0018FF7B95|nr:nicotinamide-nucleotide amidase [Methylobacillus glycogenes]